LAFATFYIILLSFFISKPISNFRAINLKLECSLRLFTVLLFLVKSPVLFWITKTGRSVHFGQLAEGATFLKNQNINKTNYK
jgi:hypothetical protein